MSRPLTNIRPFVLLAAALVGLSLPAAAQNANLVNAQLGHGAEDKFPLSAQLGLTHSVGSATYVMNPSDPTLQSQLSIAPIARLGSGWIVGVTQMIGFEWTRSDSTTYANQLELSDLGVRLSYAGLRFEDLGLALALSGGYSLPISLQSRQVGSTGPMSIGSRLIWSGVAGVNAYGSARIGVNPIVASLAERFHDAAGKPLKDRLNRTINTVACNPRNEGELGGFVCLDGGFPSVFTWSLGAGAGYTPPVLNEQLYLGLDLGFAQGFSAYVPCTSGVDNLGLDCIELKSDHARDLTPRQSVQANLSLSYSPLSWFVLTGGIATGQGLWTADQKGVRVPLVDAFLCLGDGTGSGYCPAASNGGSVYVDTTFSF